MPPRGIAVSTYFQVHGGGRVMRAEVIVIEIE